MLRIECFKPTNEDWYSEYRIKDDQRYKGKYVSLSLLGLSNGMYRVCVWGNDDFGMEWDTKDKQEAKKVYAKLALKETIEKRDLKNLDFKHC